MQNEPCPLLPAVDRVLSAADSKRIGNDRGETFYRHRLRYAQSKWITGYPAQAILQLNRAFSADLTGDEPVLTEPLHQLPYPAVRWMLEQRPDRTGQFLGNPSRHWQHYATRMSGPRAELRLWRAWACGAISLKVLPEQEFPPDEKQIAEEGIQVPDLEQTRAGLETHGHPGESRLWASVLEA